MLTPREKFTEWKNAIEGNQTAIDMDLHEYLNDYGVRDAVLCFIASNPKYEKETIHLMNRIRFDEESFDKEVSFPEEMGIVGVIFYLQEKYEEANDMADAIMQFWPTHGFANLIRQGYNIGAPSKLLRKSCTHFTIDFLLDGKNRPAANVS